MGDGLAMVGERGPDMRRSTGVAMRVNQGHDVGVVRKDVCLSNTQFEVEDVQELSLYPANITLAKDTGAESPVNVLKRGII